MEYIIAYLYVLYRGKVTEREKEKAQFRAVISDCMKMITSIKRYLYLKKENRTWIFEN